MKKGDAVVRGLVPAYQNAPETVEPTVRAFHHPAPGRVPGLPLDGLGLLPAAADVRGEAKLVQRAPHLVIVIAPVSSTGQALVQAHPLGMLSAGFRPGYRQTVQSFPYQFHIMAVGPVHRQTQRHSLAQGGRRLPVRGSGKPPATTPGPRLPAWERWCPIPDGGILPATRVPHWKAGPS